MKKRSLLAMLLSGSMILSLAACSSDDGGPTPTPDGNTSTPSTSTPDASAPDDGGEKIGETVLKLAFNQTLENPEAMTMLDFSDKLYDATEGRYSIEVNPNETLGSQQQALELVQSGAIAMAIVANPIVESVNPDFSILGTPYVYDDIDHQKRLFQSDLLDDLYLSTADSGFITLACYSLGARNLYGTAPLTTPEELAGQKIRVMQSDTMVQMINLMGGVGTPMGQGDVYSAIQTGTLNGAENNIITYVDLIQYEVASHYSESNHLLVPDELVINTALFNSMSPEDQAAMKQIAKDSVGIMFDLGAELRQTYFDKAVNELGVTVHQVDITPFQENMQDFIQEVAGRSEVSQSVYDAILSVK